METETPRPRRRPSPWLLGLLGVAAVALVAYWMWPEAAVPPPAAVPATRARPANRGGGAQSTDPTDLDVRLEALNGKRPVPGEVERNPFRFKPPPPPPTPKMPVVSQAPTGPPPPPPAPPIPPIPLKFMGTVEGPGIKLAALTDCKGFTYSAREGETIDGRYRLVRIQTESVIMEYPNGTGRITIRKTGECGPVR